MISRLKTNDLIQIRGGNSFPFTENEFLENIFLVNASVSCAYLAFMLKVEHNRSWLPALLTLSSLSMFSWIGYRYASQAEALNHQYLRSVKNKTIGNEKNSTEFSNS